MRGNIRICFSFFKYTLLSHCGKHVWNHVAQGQNPHVAREREKKREREEERTAVADMPAYARLYLFRSLWTYSILTLGNKSDAQIHGCNKTQPLIRILSRFKKSVSSVVPLAWLLFLLWSWHVIQNAMHFYCLSVFFSQLGKSNDFIVYMHVHVLQAIKKKVTFLNIKNTAICCQSITI